MKKSILLVGIIAALMSCGNKKNSSNTEIVSENTAAAYPNIEMNNQAQYDTSFLNGLKEYPSKITLKENYLEVEGEKVNFPEILSLDKPTTFTGTDKNYNYSLTLTRTNLTNVNYDFKLTDKSNKNVDVISGKAVLPSLFFLGSESFEDETGLSHLTAQYNGVKEGQWLYINIALAVDDNSNYLTTIAYGNDETGSSAFELESSPILRAKL